MNSKNTQFPEQFTTALSSDDSDVQVLETHISWIFLTDSHAYKVKKPLANAFLDYSTLAKRKHYCEEELRLDRRFADDLYLDVVQITRSGASLQLDGVGPACEYAVKMRRFPAEDLLSQRLAADRVSPEDVRRFASSLASFHQSATVTSPQADFGSAHRIRRDAVDNLQALDGESVSSDIAALKSWTMETYPKLSDAFSKRQNQGMVRECHGDLHTGNIVWWKGRFIPFDGIEFNEHFRWIDILSDAAFLAMDLRAVGQTALAHQFINSYLEHSGDYDDLQLLQWYMVYRALVRAKVAHLAMQQHDAHSQEFAESRADREEHIRLATQLTTPRPPSMQIMHGLSGSGKSTVAEQIVGRYGTIRLRADVERKRLWNKPAEYRPSESETQQLYSPEMTVRTYGQLTLLAQRVIDAGYSVVVDASFLKRHLRQRFQQLASDLSIPFHIVDCTAGVDTLRHRLQERSAARNDASDADSDVLEHQLTHQEPLLPEEQQFVKQPRDVLE